MYMSDNDRGYDGHDTNIDDKSKTCQPRSIVSSPQSVNSIVNTLLNLLYGVILF